MTSLKENCLDEKLASKNIAPKTKPRKWLSSGPRKVTWLLGGAVAIAACVLGGPLLPRDKFEFASIFLSPFVQLAWELRILENVIFVPGVKSTVFKALASREYLENIRSVDLDEQDIVIATWPKSGTHLMAQMVLQIVGNGKVEFNNLHEMLSVLEYGSLDPKKPGCEDSIESFLDRGKDKKLPMNVIATHLHLSEVPYSDKAKFVVCMRDQRDTFVSGKNMMSKMMGHRLMPRDAIYYRAFFASPSRATYTGWYRSWWDLHDQSNVLFIFYEDVLQNLTATVVKVTEFLQKPVVPEIVERVRFKSSLEYMKANSKKFELPNCLKQDVQQVGATADMVNKGVSGRGKRYVPETIQKDMQTRFVETFTGTDFPIERYVARKAENSEVL